MDRVIPAEKSIGVLIVALAARVLWKWVRGDYRVTDHRHDRRDHLHAHRDVRHRHRASRTPLQSCAIGVLHGVGGTGAVVVVLLAALPATGEAMAALGIFALTSVLSLTLLTGAYSWLLTRRVLAPIYRSVLIPLLGLVGVVFGVAYAGIA